MRRVDGVTGIITTYAGGGASLGDGGPATQGQLLAPNDLVVDVQRNVYIADTGNYRIRKVDGLTGVITTLAGNGIAGFTGDGGAATAARIGTAKGLAIDYAANVYFSDVVNASNHRVRLVSAPGGLISTFAGAGPQGSAGDGGTAASANLNTPFGVVVDPGGRVQMTDKSNHRIRAVK